MSEERLRILEMIQNGKITAAEGLELLEALTQEDSLQGSSLSLKSSTNLKDRLLIVKVDSSNSKVNVNVPLTLIKATSKLVTAGMGMIPEEARREMEKKGIDITKLDFEEIVDLLDQGLSDGRLVDVVTEDKHGITKVEVYVE